MTRLVIGPHHSGKTNGMIEWLDADVGRLLIVEDEDAQRRLVIRHKDIGHRIMTWSAY